MLVPIYWVNQLTSNEMITSVTQQTKDQGGAPSFVGNSDNRSMYDPAKLCGYSGKCS